MARIERVNNVTCQHCHMRHCQFGVNLYNASLPSALTNSHRRSHFRAGQHQARLASPSGGIGRRSGFKILCPYGRAGSSPASGTTVFRDVLRQNNPFTNGFLKPQNLAWGQIWGQHRVCIDFVSLVLFTLYEKNQTHGITRNT